MTDWVILQRLELVRSVRAAIEDGLDKPVRKRMALACGAFKSSLASNGPILHEDRLLYLACENWLSKPDEDAARMAALFAAQTNIAQAVHVANFDGLVDQARAEMEQFLRENGGIEE